MNSSLVYFVFPGNLDTPTGGYHYDRRLIGELRAAGLTVEPVSLPAGFPFPDQAARSLTRQALATLPDQIEIASMTDKNFFIAPSAGIGQRKPPEAPFARITS